MFGFIKGGKGPHRILLNHSGYFKGTYAFINNNQLRGVSRLFIFNIRHTKEKEIRHEKMWSPVDNVISISIQQRLVQSM